MPERILQVATAMSGQANDKITEIKAVTRATRTLALNALIEAARAGEVGRGFGVVANEVKEISQRVTVITEELESMFLKLASDLEETAQMARGDRFSDLARYAVELMDRNLFERSCDVRWWATDAAVVDVCVNPHDEAIAQRACNRLGVILDSYTVYLDLWVADKSGNVIANGRPDSYRLKGQNISDQAWFHEALRCRDGGHYAVADVEQNPMLNNAATPTYATAVRKGGDVNGEVIGVMGVFFDWESQAPMIVKSLNFSPEERERTRVMLIDANNRVLAASDDKGILSEKFTLRVNDPARGAYLLDDGALVAYALTPGYETYEGLGWRGVIVQAPRSENVATA
ncbi:methyl-accepting chemotaxis protein [Thalassospira sp.]|uniref:methyl-accepting chemotaxis protein n=1 Tax=Thalassospira sp. TaxID=1912094 RepID=UPI000C4388B8|nr:methyl-accepting chemotaxis protein [Thalassospira sp.]MBC07976.1 chemotaxis protein [Thalassospira sp.]|tara:strand:+ start:4489 stop:5520 length:1032 start_codon:yes stop_codon:yes gene_type:complete